MQAKIRHVAVMCQDAPRVARFYELLFALTSKAQTSDELHAKMFGAPVLGSKRVVRPYERTIIVSDGNSDLIFFEDRRGIRKALTISVLRSMTSTRFLRA